eukprot:CAMPEP_0206277976 /NCGR_PEP_ID=MMETSP0047_2-20121206/37160_1 /ASSEMBLY_ACC=CAM_ASM_000192 /TAXON_ID=195065 /ORGANISM="Chroomonas mesostigmatica_cf, Strain CCMP1168" /LENGTH=174 /DNA_ID=CAMNT_0053707663 /DNA_START=99 /DNA_END=621 /DNA_ORIENTATION=-
MSLRLSEAQLQLAPGHPAQPPMRLVAATPQARASRLVDREGCSRELRAEKRALRGRVAQHHDVCVVPLSHLQIHGEDAAGAAEGVEGARHRVGVQIRPIDHDGTHKPTSRVALLPLCVLILVTLEGEGYGDVAVRVEVDDASILGADDSDEARGVRFVAHPREVRVEGALHLVQ